MMKFIKEYNDSQQTTEDKIKIIPTVTLHVLQGNSFFLWAYPQAVLVHFLTPP